MTIALADKMEFLEIEARFDRWIDTGNIDAWVAQFAADGVFEASYGSARGHTELRKFMEKLESGFSKGKRHVSVNHVVESAGDDAKVSAYLVVFERENAPHVVATGTYVNTYRRFEGQWKVVHRKLDIDPGWQKADGAAVRRREEPSRHA